MRAYFLASAIFVGVLVSATSARADVASLSFANVATGYSDGAPTPWAFAPLNLGSIVNNGYGVFSTAVEFDISSLPTGATVNSAMLSGFLSNNPFDPCPEVCGDRSIQVHGYAGIGIVPLESFAVDGLVGSSVIGVGNFDLSFDVTGFIGGLIANANSFAGFVWREEPGGPNSLMGLSVYDGPTLTIDYSTVAAVPEPETYAMLVAGLGLLGFVAGRRKLKKSVAT